jgi:hypothetical protein
LADIYLYITFDKCSYFFSKLQDCLFLLTTLSSLKFAAKLSLKLFNWLNLDFPILNPNSLNSFLVKMSVTRDLNLSLSLLGPTSIQSLILVKSIFNILPGLKLTIKLYLEIYLFNNKPIFKLTDSLFRL